MDNTNNKEKYRKAILDKYGYDINKWNQQLKGGKADKKDLTSFNLNSLIKGIGIEKEHTKDIGRALEITTDHLTEFDNYYNELPKFEDKLKQKDKSQMNKKYLAKEAYKIYKKYNIPVDTQLLKETIDYVTDYLDELDQKSNGFKENNLTPEEQQIVDELLNSEEMQKAMRSFVEAEVDKMISNRSAVNSNSNSIPERKKSIKEDIISNVPDIKVGDQVKVDTKQLFMRNSNVPSYIRLVQQTIRKSPDRCPFVCEIKGDDVGLGESPQAGMFLGCVFVPKKYVKQVPNKFQPNNLSVVNTEE